MRKRNPGEVEECISESRELAERARASLQVLGQAGISEEESNEIKGFSAYAARQADQMERRLVLGEKIPSEEKVLSIFEKHTR